LVLGLVAACYSPSIATEVPCSPEGLCPGDQQCDLTRNPPTCVDQLQDAGGIDTPTACSTDADCKSATASICDPEQKICRGCTADAECANAGVCSESRGTCIAEPDALFVAPNGANLGPCSAAVPCLTITYALMQATAARNIIRVGRGTYAEQVNIRDGLTVTLSGEDDNPDGEVISITNVGAIVNVENGAVTLEGLSITGGSGEGISSRDTLTVYRVIIARNQRQGINHQGGGSGNALLVVRASTISDNMNEGIVTQDGTATITRSYIAENRNGGLRVNRTTLTLINTMIVQNGQLGGNGPGLRIMNNAGKLSRVEHLTIAGNNGGIYPGAQCDQPVTIKSSILANNGMIGFPQLQGCNADHCLFSAGAPQGMGNKDGNPDFVNASLGDFHIGPGSDAIDKAGMLVDIFDDYDGDVRSGAPDIGADER
jgi:hypothetical protein